MHFASANIRETCILQVAINFFMETNKQRSDCPLSCSLDVFGDKWSLLIIRDLIFFQKSSYKDFLESAEGIATNILASRLKGLEENGIIEKYEHPERKAKYLYRLTSKGIDLLPILMEVYIWSDKYFPVPAEIKATIKEAKKDKVKFARILTKALKNKLNE